MEKDKINYQGKKRRNKYKKRKRGIIMSDESLYSKYFTLTSLPIVGQVKTIRAKAKDTSWCVQAYVRTTSVVIRALVDVLASMVVQCQFKSRDIGAAALVTAFEITTGTLTRAVSVVRQTLVNICYEIY